MAMKGIPQARLVTTIIPANNTIQVINIPEQPDLRYARVLGIDILTATDFANCYPSNVASLPDANLANIALTLETNDADDWDNTTGANGRFGTTGQHFKYIPVALFHRVQNATPSPFVRQLFETNNIYVTWEKSFFTLSPGGIGNATDIAIPMVVYWTWRDIMGNLITRT